MSRPPKIHALASREQYERHIRAVWKHLPDDVRGEFLTHPQATGNQLPLRDVVMIGGASDVERVRQQLIYVEHGSGQAYSGSAATRDRVGYHGANLDERVRWFIAPRAEVADAWIARGRRAFVAGCPALDEIRAARPLSPTVGFGKQPTAVITFHWDAARFSPEAGSAVEHYRNALPAIVRHLRAQGFHVSGHFHPRTPTMRATWRAVGVDVIEDVDDVLKSCHLLIADNTSVLFEAAALDIPVLVLNCPRYRRNVFHGLRFWSHVPGWQIDGPEDLLALDVGAYVRSDWSQAERRAAACFVYGRPPGGCGQAAAEWIVGQLG